MTENRFWCLEEYKSKTSPIVDRKFAPTNGWLCDKINEFYQEKEQLTEENKELKELIELIADAGSYREENSVKEILRNEIWGIDSVAGEYSSAWHDCVILSNFFERYYGEHWDNDKFD